MKLLQYNLQWAALDIQAKGVVIRKIICVVVLLTCLIYSTRYSVLSTFPRYINLKSEKLLYKFKFLLYFLYFIDQYCPRTGRAELNRRKIQTPLVLAFTSDTDQRCAIFNIRRLDHFHLELRSLSTTEIYMHHRDIYESTFCT